jgi:hypothetical protein
MRTTKHILLIVSSAIFLFSCTPQKRLNRLIALHPELKTTDTIRIQDTTIIPATRIDTSFHESKLNDTVIITKEKLKLKLHRIHDTVYVEAVREADTLVVVKEVAVERVVVKNNAPKSENGALNLFGLYNYRIFILIGLGILFLLVIWRGWPR